MSICIKNNTISRLFSDDHQDDTATEQNYHALYCKWFLVSLTLFLIPPHKDILYTDHGITLIKFVLGMERQSCFA